MSWHYLQESSDNTIVRAAAMFDRVHGEEVTDFIIIDQKHPAMLDHIIITAEGDELTQEKLCTASWAHFNKTDTIASRIIAEEEIALNCNLYGFKKERKGIIAALRRKHSYLPAPIPRKQSYPQEAIQYIYDCLSSRWIDFLVDLAEFDNFLTWYDDATTFHPAFQYIYELAAGPADNVTDGVDFDELVEILTALYSCLVLYSRH